MTCLFPALALVSLLLLAALAASADRWLRSPRCPACGGATHATAERLLCRLPLVVEVSYRCPACGRSIVRFLAAPAGD